MSADRFYFFDCFVENLDPIARRREFEAIAHWATCRRLQARVRISRLQVYLCQLFPGDAFPQPFRRPAAIAYRRGKIRGRGAQQLKSLDEIRFA